MNTTLKRISTAALMVSFLAGAGLSARPDREGPKMDTEKRLEHMQKNLNLSAEQTEQIRAIMKKYQPQREALVQKLRPLNKELFELMAQEEPNRNAIKAKMQQISDIRIELRLLMLDGRTETFKVLNADQKAKWKEQMKKFAEKRGPKGKDRD